MLPQVTSPVAEAARYRSWASVHRRPDSTPAVPDAATADLVPEFVRILALSTYASPTHDPTSRKLPMRILMAAPRRRPPSRKTGGLADVASGLSKALAKLGHEVTLVLPYYRKITKPELAARWSGS